MRADIRVGDDAGARRIAYRPELDGLRALAVAAVLVFHHSEMLSGGFLGVDIFFVLSGYLITSLLLAEHRATGRIDLPDFWRRRARRLLPAVFLLLLAVAAIAAWVLPESGAQIRRDGLATLFYVENWYRIEAQPPAFPLGHAWSLSIEEQWYLVWPLLFGLLVRRARRLDVAAAVAGVAGLASAVGMALVYGDGGGRDRAYLGTDTRAQGLLVGAALAMLLAHLGTRTEPATPSGPPGATDLLGAADRSGRPGSRGRYRPVGAGSRGTMRVALDVAGVAAVAFLAFLIFTADVHDVFFYRGGFLLVALAVAVVITVATRSEHGVLRRVLAWRPLVAIGLVSYGLYLFHLPVYTWLTPRSTYLDPVPLLALRVGVTAAAAVASYRWVERPVRMGAWPTRRTFVAAVGAAAAVVGVLFLATTTTPLPPDQARLAYAMRIAAERAGDRDTRIAVVGGNLAFALAVRESVHDGDGYRGVAWGRLGCGIAKGAPVLNGKAYPPAETCAQWPEQFALVADRFDPDVAVLLAGDSEAFDRAIGNTTLRLRSPELDRHLKGQLDRARAKLGGGDTHVVLGLPAACDPSGAAAPDAVEAVRDLWREWAAARDVDVLDLADLLCPDGAPARTTDGGPVLDNGSFTPAGARAAWEWIAAEVTDP